MILIRTGVKGAAKAPINEVPTVHSAHDPNLWFSNLDVAFGSRTVENRPETHPIAAYLSQITTFKLILNGPAILTKMPTDPKMRTWSGPGFHLFHGPPRPASKNVYNSRSWVLEYNGRDEYP